MNASRFGLALAAASLTTICSAEQAWRVDDDAADGGDGLTWATAFNDLQSALSVATAGDEIWIAEGVYTPSDTDAAASFVLVNGVSLYGGFFGNETARDQRDPAIFQSVLSGDIGQDDITDPSYELVGLNSGHVIVASGVDSTTVIDGLTIERGANGPQGPNGGIMMWGGGVFSIGGSPTINNCVIQFNSETSGKGGGMYFEDASPIITNCLFWGNIGNYGDGAAIAIDGTGGALIEDCQFWWNEVIFGLTDSWGGAISHDSLGQLTVRRSVFEFNRMTQFFPVGDDRAFGGGISSYRGPLLVEDSVFRNNRATIGGGIAARNEAKIVNCLFDNNHAVARESDIGELGGFGGGFASYSFAARDMYLENSTFVNNTSKEHGGASGAQNSNMVVTNCIFWDNSGWNPEFAGYYREQIGGNFDIRYSLVPGIFGPPAAGEDPMDPESLVGCIESDPMFVGGGDYRLAAGSPAIDAGENAGWTSTWATDLDGNPRFVDDPDTVDTGAGVAPLIDMGAYEFQVASNCAPDLNGDGVLDFFDVSAFLASFAAQDPIADYNSDGLFDFFDVAAYLAAFAAGCP